MRSAIVFEVDRSGYSIDQVADKALTVGDLKEMLESYDDDTLVIWSHDNGYTYGALDAEPICADEDEDGDWEVYR